MMRYILVFLLTTVAVLYLEAQTVGFISGTDEVQPGYTLFAPISTGETYLIDECGQKINEWSVDGNAGLMARLTDEGSLIYCRRTGSDFFAAGGIGGQVIALAWNGMLQYILPLADEEFHQHHDINILPNGNLLLVGWEYISAQEAKAQGRSIVNEGGIWSEKIREIKPNGGIDPEVVWEWRVWDHLIQSVSDTFPNYGFAVENPHRIDLNFTNGITPSVQDWLHVNAVDYNEELDQIIVNCRNFSEFWVIDHSTSTEEAAGTAGGNFGKGGDILFRWGNPGSYGAGSDNERAFYAQHDAHWLPAGSDDYGKIAVFNNGLGRPDGLYSTIDFVEPVIENNAYQFIGNRFAPLDVEIFYGGPEGDDQYIFSSRISGSQRLENGNTLICLGQLGEFIEINADKEIVWDYINPAGNVITTQGDPPNGANNVFQAVKYEYDFAGFEGKNMEPGNRIELEPIDNCELILNTEIAENYDIDILTNVVQSQINIISSSSTNYRFQLFNSSGILINSSADEIRGNTIIELSNQPIGMYVLVLFNDQKRISTSKIIKTYE